MRRKNLEELKKRRGGREDVLYPPFTSTTSISDFIQKWNHISKGEVIENEHFTLCGMLCLSLSDAQHTSLCVLI
jgi:hypothetical protein